MLPDLNEQIKVSDSSLDTHQLGKLIYKKLRTGEFIEKVLRTFKFKILVLLLCSSKNSTTHTFTVMPTISRGSELKKDIFVILQETQGKFVCKLV